MCDSGCPAKKPTCGPRPSPPPSDCNNNCNAPPKCEKMVSQCCAEKAVQAILACQGCKDDAPKNNCGCPPPKQDSCGCPPPPPSCGCPPPENECCEQKTIKMLDYTCCDSSSGGTASKACGVPACGGNDNSCEVKPLFYDGNVSHFILCKC